jgi:hypothetical protein
MFVNTQIVYVIAALGNYCIIVSVYDTWANPAEVQMSIDQKSPQLYVIKNFMQRY